MLAQEHLAETMTGRKIVWNRLEVPSLLEAGILPDEISERLAVELAEAKNSAYGIAEEISQREEHPNDNRPLATADEFPVEGDYHSQGWDKKLSALYSCFAHSGAAFAAGWIED